MQSNFMQVVELICFCCRYESTLHISTTKEAPCGPCPHITTPHANVSSRLINMNYWSTLMPPTHPSGIEKGGRGFGMVLEEGVVSHEKHQSGGTCRSDKSHFARACPPLNRRQIELGAQSAEWRTSVLTAPG